MKNNKTATFLLLAAVCIIWGAVAFRLLSSAPSSPPPAGPSPAVQNPSRTSYRFPDNAYPDPFLKNLPELTGGTAPSTSGSPRRNPSLKKSGPPAKENHVIHCRGKIIKNGTPYYLLTIDGTSCLLKPGETACGLKLLHPPAPGDSLTLIKKGHIYRTGPGTVSGSGF